MSSRKSVILHFDALLLSKACKVSDQKVHTEELCLMTLKSDTKFEEKRTLGSKNNIRNSVTFNLSGSKSENFHFDVLLLSKVYYV